MQKAHGRGEPSSSNRITDSFPSQLALRQRAEVDLDTSVLLPFRSSLSTCIHVCMGAFFMVYCSLGQ
jgi:hypothetical protein